MEIENQRKIGIVDFGGQYAHLIASRIRRLGAYSEVLSNEHSANYYSEFAGLILSGGPESVYAENSPSIDADIFQLEIPILGICYGHQLMMKALGGGVEKSIKREYGPAKLDILNGKGLLEGMKNSARVWMSHGDEVTSLPNGFETIARSKNCNFAAVQNSEKKRFGLQFHPEVTHSEYGSELLKNFVKICKVEHSWSIQEFLDKKIQELKDTVPSDKKVFLFVSGGVDSTVCYVLLTKALGDERVRGFIIDTGFMRKNEVSDLVQDLTRQGIHLTVRDESQNFLSLLQSENDPERKRLIVGNQFLRARENAIQDLGLNPSEWILGQGTIYPDTIESGGTKHSHTIKTHHNRVPEIQELLDSGNLIEPIKELYKDEVRELGILLGLDKKLVMRHPFPGPGLVVRMVASKMEKDMQILEEARSLVHKLRPEVEVDLLPVAAVGVQGDQRTYSAGAVLTDLNLSWEEYDTLATEMTNLIPGMNRVVLLVGEEALPAEFLFHPMRLEKTTADLLREADFCVNEIIRSEGIFDEIWQMPVVLIPVGDDSKHFSIVLRPVQSQEAMTANFYPMERSILEKIRNSILEIPNIAYVFYDLTHKPPGTIEWE